MFTAVVLFANLLLARALPQLLPPPSLPTVAKNFRLVAHVIGFPDHDLVPSIENWEVVASSTACSDAYAILTGGISSGLSFYWDPNTESVQSFRSLQSLGLSINHYDIQNPVSFSCGQGSPGVGISLAKEGPRLAHQEGGQLYACPMMNQSVTPLVQLFHRDSNAMLPQSCVDVVLYAECADGPDHGAESLAVCCFDVMDGECRMSL